MYILIESFCLCLSICGVCLWIWYAIRLTPSEYAYVSIMR